MKKLLALVAENYIYLINVLALASVLGSLYFSEYKDLPPCDLCWYARIFMYPMAVISTVAIISKDQKAYRYILPLSIAGSVLTLYHYGLQKTDVVGDVVAACGGGSGHSCSTIDVEYFGFITIPLMGFAAFFGITVIAAIRVWKNKN